MAKKKVKKEQEKGKQSAKAKKPAQQENKVMRGLVPYILVLLGVIFLICFFTVQVLGIEDGAGIVGYGIQYFLCGLFGVAAFLIPVVLIYVGVKWIIYNIKSKRVKPNTSEDEELKSSRKRIVLQTVMSGLLIVLLATFVGIIADSYDSFDIVGMWLDAGGDLEGGGIIGGSLAVLMVMAFESLISSIIVIAAIIIVAILMLGLTPDRIIMFIQEKRDIRREERLEEELALEAERLREEKRRGANPKAEDADDDTDADRRGAKGKRAAAMSVDEIFEDDGEGAAEAVAEPDDEIYIGPSEESIANNTGKINIDLNNTEDNSVGGDFGGDPVFDDPEFKGISGVIDNLRSESDAAAENEEPAEELDIGLIAEEELLSDIAAVAPDEELDEEPVEVEMPYVFPHYDLLKKNTDNVQTDYQDELRENAQILVDTLKSFKVGVREVTYSRGPTITRYELKPEVGTRVRSIANLVDDIALNLATSGVRIEAPIPNKAAVGIEVPNRERATVYLRDLIENPKFIDSKSRLTASLGMDVGGNPIYFDITKMPHLLIAGTTGSGKSICINSIIISILYKSKPSDVKLILIDPKKVEFNMYKTIPHLYCPIVSEPKKAAGALASAVAEMEKRFELIECEGVRDIAGYNAAIEGDPTKEFMPHMVIIIDELADLMMTAREDVETSICRLAQKARAAGIHLILGTQRPSVDVITGLIKANVPSRIACTVNSQVDSRTIIDVAGAENLIGRGDMLFAPVGSSKPMRVQGAFVSDNEVENVVNFISENNGKAKYNTDFINRIEEEAAKCGSGKKGGGGSFEADDSADTEGGDSKFRDAVKLAIEEGKISTSLMQRRLGVGYGRAAKIIDTMEDMGYVSKPDGNKPRRVLITMEEYSRRIMDNNLGGDDAE